MIKCENNEIKIFGVPRFFNRFAVESARTMDRVD